ncbi:MAG TPA: hypothetical protein DC017_04230 [Candidatus Wallbacteria bacterium]|nr:hypothetical protein [Candidatus Wallbacteria bacterium]
MNFIKSILKKILIAGLILTAVCLLLAHYAYMIFMKAPATRISSGMYYERMPEDENHRYIDLPLDHKDPGSKKFRGFYILNPGFKKGSEVVFFLTDGQMQLVGTNPDFSFFSSVIGGTRSYVLIGVRGLSPILFPEVYNAGGSLNYKAAMNLYGSDQQVEDIECVRKDMQKKGYLPPGAKIMVFGASGAGILAQQYISKYPDSVSRAILAVTGAPDISSARGWAGSPDFKDFNPEGTKLIGGALKKSGADICALSYMLYQMARGSSDAVTVQNDFLKKLVSGEFGAYFKVWMKPQFNQLLLNTILKAPSAAAMKVRWYELFAADLKKYKTGAPENINLLYEYSQTALADFIEKDTGENDLTKIFKIDRAGFTGEVLVMCASRDVVFSTEISRAIASEYKNSKIAVFDDCHRLLKDPGYYLKLRIAFYNGGFNSREFQELYDAPANRK